MIQSSSVCCPCCGHRTLRERGAFEICPVCFWQDDGQDEHNAAESLGGPNEISLSEGRSNYKLFGASRRQDLTHVRLPRPDERVGDA
ncbi:CPCC family cysteine-rich protein [Pirellulimonas nuda]|uniref:CPCC family cysteine-rich protein n=1 Tax=Pirellulimonas nuda TaxID=2528009 RepID=UPI0011A3C824